MKPTLVIGASEDPQKYSNQALKLLIDHGHKVYAYGIKPGSAYGVEIQIQMLPLKVHTITMYVSPKNQTQELKSYILSLNPDRVIFNPGTENPEWYHQLEESHIRCEESCTLVLLSTGQY